MQLSTRALILAVFATIFLCSCSSSNSGFPGPPALSADASLADLSISAGELMPGFQTATKNYAASVNFLQEDIRLTAVSSHVNAIIRLNGVVITSGERSDPTPLMEGLNTMTVTVLAEDGVTSDSYSVEITRESASSFAQKAYIKMSNTDIEDESSGSPALFENTLVVGALAEDSASTGINGDQADNSAADAGAVYVFTRDAAGTWSQQAYIKASNTDAGDLFGRSVAIYEDTLAVGAFLEDGAGTGINSDQSDNGAATAGAVYVYTRDAAGIWSQQAYIKASNTDADDRFGESVALYEDTLAVGARFEDSASTGIDGDQSDNSAVNAGAAYVFTRDGAGDWSQQAYVKASNSGANDSFGAKVALHEDSLIVAAAAEDSAATGIDGDESDNSANNAGAVYAFSRDAAGIWSQQAYIKASNAEADDDFGWSVTIHENTLAVGARREDSAGTGIGGDESDNSAIDSGAAYVFTRDGTGTWSQQAYLKASNTDPGDQFGRAIALYGNALVVASTFEASSATGIDGIQSDNSSPVAGAIYVFTRDAAGVWGQQAYVKASNTEAGDVFSWPAIFGNTIVVGATGEASAATGVDGDQSDNNAPASGAVYVFQ